MPDFSTEYVLRVAKLDSAVVSRCGYPNLGAAVAAAGRVSKRTDLLVLGVTIERTESIEVDWESNLIPEGGDEQSPDETSKPHKPVELGLKPVVRALARWFNADYPDMPIEFLFDGNDD